MKLFSRLIPCSMLLLAATSIASAAETPVDSSKCSVKSQSDAVVVMICPTAYKDAEWKAAGAAACKDKQLCNVWIWDSAAKAPATAPATDAMLPKDKTAQAVAIWVHDSKSLVALKPKPKA